MSKIVFIVTGAHSIANVSDALARERYIEYMIALHKIFTYNKPVYSVLSEYDSETSHCPPFDLFSMTTLLKLPISFLDDAKTKSQREFLSIKELVRNMNLEDDTFVIKLSGRYIILKDTLYNLVEQYKDNKNVNAIVCIPPAQLLQQYTFLFAMRWKFFKEFYELPLSIVSTKNIERVIVEFCENKNIVNSIINIERLDILANINNENKFQIF